MIRAKQSTGCWTRRLITVTVVLLVLAVIAEIVLRSQLSSHNADLGQGAFEAMLPVMQQIEIQEQLNQATYVADPDLGALMAPGRLDVVETREFTYTRRTDHAGFPNQDPWPSDLDVAVLGDSLLVGAGVGFEGRFTTLLQHRLGGRSVLNLGVPGGGTEHQLRVYRKFVEPLRPKLVVAVLWVTWDIDNSLQLDRWLAEKSTMEFTPYRMTFGDTHRSDDTSEATSRMAKLVASVRRFLSRSYLLKTAYQGIKSRHADDGPVERVAFSNGETLLLAVRDQHRLAKGLERPTAPDIEEIFFRPLAQLRSDVQAHGGQLVVVLVPSKEELYASEAFPEVLRSWQQVKAGLDARQLPTLDLYPVFRRRERDRPPFYRVDAHLNHNGNQIVADALAQWIMDAGILASSHD